ncbi:tyrosinase family protein [Flavobacterium polysaccharolyticum]|uniref:Tyrosinase family protein n=1 Tax=Flavobacterium polysaccharolyticum TaxID=3133148 RepID=A0ABU9NY53_9FLAO
MTNFTRKNAWNNGGEFIDPSGNYTDLYWYAKGVNVMMSKQLNDPTSWWFYAAIHGFSTREWSRFPTPPSVPTTPLPDNSTINLYWNQCQHQSWYFAPWHRGYLIAIENQIRTEIIKLNGPADWALPYWNYFGTGNENYIPTAFTQKKLPDGNENPLFVTARYGPNDDGIVYVDTQVVNEKCQNNTIYTGSNSETPPPGYGGPETGFHHSKGTSGNLENNPHNYVHGMVGGNNGMMSYPNTAGLDPIFYLHHCNIDRMWASWNADGNNNPNSKKWLNGPASIGEREFAMPKPDGSSWIYTPNDVDNLDKLNYTYESLKTTATPQLESLLAQRMNKFGVNTTTSLLENMDSESKIELVGANQSALKLSTTSVETSVKLDKKSWKPVPKSFLKASLTNIPDQIYLHLENVTGTMDSNILYVSIKEQEAGHVSLFGLGNASDIDGAHGGGGLTFIIDITNIIDDIHLESGLDIESLDVKIATKKTISNSDDITIGRVSIYRKKN